MSTIYAVTRIEYYRDNEDKPQLDAYGRRMTDDGEPHGDELRLGALTPDVLESDSDGTAWALLGGDRCLLRNGDAEHVHELAHEQAMEQDE